MAALLLEQSAERSARVVALGARAMEKETGTGLLTSACSL